MFFLPNSSFFKKLTLTSPKFWYWALKFIFLYRFLFHESYFRSNNLMRKLLLSNLTPTSTNIIEFAVGVGLMRMVHISANICILVPSWWNCLGKDLEWVALLDYLLGEGFEVSRLVPFPVFPYCPPTCKSRCKLSFPPSAMTLLCYHGL